METTHVTNSPILSKLEDILRSELDDDSLQIRLDMSAEDVTAWDSLAHIRIIAAIEREYDVQFDLDQIESFQSVGDIVKSLEASGVS